MTFLPNKIIRYTSRLRIYVSNSIIRKGYQGKHKEQLRKIYNTEALFCNNEPTPVNIELYLSILLTSIFIIKKEIHSPFCFKINIKGNYLINIKPFCALILNLASNSDKVILSTQNGKLLIKSKNINKHSLCFIKKLNGCVYTEKKEKNSLIVLPVTATDKADILPIKSIEEQISNPFSHVNIFIN